MAIEYRFAIRDPLFSVPMSKQEPKKRIHNFDEVALGYNEDEALREATRCLNCSDPQCSKGCPLDLNIPEFIKLIKEKKYFQALEKVKEKSCFPVICGRICPQEKQCQKSCARGKKGESIAIGRLERFIADREPEYRLSSKILPKTRKKIAVVGAGPAGLTVAANLAKFGHEVVIFEALHFAGGLLSYGVPEFRLPKKIVRREVRRAQELGVKIYTDARIVKLSVINGLIEKGFDAVFIGAGAGSPIPAGLPGENLEGVYSANEFLMRVILKKSYRYPAENELIRVGKKAVIIGGGNVAIDAARTAIRLGAEQVMIFYRRSREEMPARDEEVLNAQEEGIEFRFLVAPKRFIADEQGKVRRMEYIKMELGEPDETGRRKPIPIEGSETIMDVDFVAIGIGRHANPLGQNLTMPLKVGKEGLIVVEEETSRTSCEGIYAGGDIASGEASVINAMCAGRRAAISIDEYLMKASRWPQIKVSKSNGFHVAVAQE